MNKRYFGVFFILAAIFLILTQTGLIVVHLPIWKLIVGIFLVAIFIDCVRKVEFFGILVPLAVLLVLFGNELGLSSVSLWPVIVTAILASIGLHILFGNNNKPYTHQHPTGNGHLTHDPVENSVHGEHCESAENLGSDTVESRVSFGTAIKHLHSKNLKTVKLYCSFSSLKVYFNQAVLVPGGTALHLDSSFSSVELYVPHGWLIENNISSGIGAAIKNNAYTSVESESVLRLEGSVTLGSVEIIVI